MTVCSFARLPPSCGTGTGNRARGTNAEVRVFGGSNSLRWWRRRESNPRREKAASRSFWPKNRHLSSKAFESGVPPDSAAFRPVPPSRVTIWGTITFDLQRGGRRDAQVPQCSCTPLFRWQLLLAPSAIPPAHHPRAEGAAFQQPIPVVPGTAPRAGAWPPSPARRARACLHSISAQQTRSDALPLGFWIRYIGSVSGAR